MSDWKTGEPPEDGWYWVWWMGFDRALPAEWDGDQGVFYLEDYALATDVEGCCWQGPLTPPDPPES